MIGDLKIKIDKDPVTGEQRVPPEVMRLLTELAEHRRNCIDCDEHGKGNRLCVTGEALLIELYDQPEVQVENIRPDEPPKPKPPILDGPMFPPFKL